MLKKTFNAYATLNFDRSIQNTCWKLGAHHVGKVCDSDNRLRVDFDEGRPRMTWYHHTVVNKNNWVFGCSNLYDIQKQQVGNMKLALGYQWKKWAFFLRAENESWQGLGVASFKEWVASCNKLAFNVISEYDDKTKLGFEV